MTRSFDIRLATARDESCIRACADEAYGQYIAAIGKKPAPMLADFGALIASGWAYVAEAPEIGVVGVIVFYQDGDGLFLESVAVRSSAKGLGIGKRLIAFCEDHARRAGLRKVRLYTNAKMTENLAIYPHLGFRETERRHEDGFDRVFFEKVLS